MRYAFHSNEVHNFATRCRVVVCQVRGESLKTNSSPDKRQLISLFWWPMTQKGRLGNASLSIVWVSYFGFPLKIVALWNHLILTDLNLNFLKSFAGIWSAFSEAGWSLDPDTCLRYMVCNFTYSSYSNVTVMYCMNFSKLSSPRSDFFCTCLFANFHF